MRKWFWLLGCLLWTSCSATYPKGKIEDDVRKLFQKEMKTEVTTQLVGRTLYVAFSIDGLLDKSLDLTPKLVDQLESAMISISRITLSTDADIDFTVIQALEYNLSLEIRVVRRLQDLKDMYYWRISKPDFDERMILYIGKQDGLDKEKIPTGAALVDMNKLKLSDPHMRFAVEAWHDLTLKEFMAQQLASRVNVALKKNPFLGIVAGVDQIREKYFPEKQLLQMTAQSYDFFGSTQTAALTKEFLTRTIVEEARKIEKAYLHGPDSKIAQNWVEKVSVCSQSGDVLLEIENGQWAEESNNKKPEGRSNGSAGKILKKTQLYFKEALHAHAA